MTETVRLGLPLIEAAQAQKHVPHNEALAALDMLVQAVALDRDLAAPPASPTNGDLYVVAAAPTGDWLGRADALALRVEGGWTFRTPQPGWCVWVRDESRPVVWTGSAWLPLHQAIGSFADLAGVGIGTAPDANNRLAVRAPAALFAAEPAAGGGDGDMRLTIEKETAADTASLLFQTGWSGRAEIGLAGDDDLHVKVSPDGSTWTDALRVAAATGELTLVPGGLTGGGRLKSMVGFSASGTWTRPTGIRFALVFALGGGGGGGGASGAASSGAAAGGGGAGGLAVSYLDVTTTASAAVTVGAGGNPGASTGAAGSSGGQSSFGASVVGSGGAGGQGMTAGTTAAVAIGGAGGSTGAGDLGFTGAPGGAALRLDGTVVMSGVGAASFFGGGGRAAVSNATGSGGTARGSGGGGAAVSASATGRTGGTGAAGFVWVWEFE